jgi:Pyridoxamine 5'-phosphate oxidase
MGDQFLELDEDLQAFIAAQRMFFVATAPLSADGHINLSPKGLECLRVLGSREVAYLDLTGSGIETVAHVRENGRLTLMFCAFEGPPRILRLHGRARIVEPGDPDWNRLLAQFPEYAGPRSIVVLYIERIADSCGFGVPLFEYKGERTQLDAWAERKGPDGIAEYKSKKNRRSIDGLPGLSFSADNVRPS